MLRLGELTGRTCQSQSRRSFLRIGAIGPLGLGLADYLALRAQAQGSSPPARAVIFLWLWGAPSQLDTFDMKPDAPAEYRGPFGPIETSAPGIRICELLPGLARKANKFALVRTMHHDEPDHGLAGTLGLTGSKAGGASLGGQIAGATQPSLGAIVSRLRQRKSAPLPSHIILGDELQQGRKRVIGEGGGMLGHAHDPFRLRYETGRGLVLPEVELPKHVGEKGLTARWDLRRSLDTAAANALPSGPSSALDRHFELAHQLITSRAGLSALDVEREPAAVHERYGSHRFGQCCLIARRLVEAGQPFVQVNWSSAVEPIEDTGDGGWDMHDRYFSIMQDQHGWILDQALSSLIGDLDERGLLESTLVVAVGEFGRSPKINDRAGREHHSQCYTALLAGGGVRGGTVVGASDRRAERPVDRAFSPADLAATVLARLGIGTSNLTAINLSPTGQPIEDLFS